MDIKVQPMGDYQTNCYIVTYKGKDLIIDPGVESIRWVNQNVTNPIAILNTHGHFDHVWSNTEVQKTYNLKIYTPIGDKELLQTDPYGLGMPSSIPDIDVKPDEEFELEGIKIKFHHFPGHTQGCSAIQIEDKYLFTGDFIFKGTIGRFDFPMSDASMMKKSIQKILKWENDFHIYPGHGDKTTLRSEIQSLKQWESYI
jgi:glyoxylase-like metal-dependent hydrolase (beta-lactamase superfamily II)